MRILRYVVRSAGDKYYQALKKTKSNLESQQSYVYRASLYI